MRDYYKVLIVAQSGAGKTYSARNLDPATTGFINVEDKPLPFKNQFVNHARCHNTTDALKALKKFADDDTVEVIFFDSFSAFVDLLLYEARDAKRGFDIWNHYNEQIGKLLNYIKSIQKEVIITAHYESLNIEGDSEKRVKVKGKEWEGVIEKEFTIVMYADRTLDDKNKVTAWFDLSLNGSSAKCPPDIFGPSVSRIDNDCKKVIDAIVAFAKP